MKEGTLLAGVDLGSNSFRLEIGRFANGHIERVDYLKETVRQGNGLDENRCLTPDAIERGVRCLERFGERLRGFLPTQVRAVATQTLREARNQDEFITVGQKALGFPIEVVSGNEEARLIYQGVSHLLPQSPERRLVLDIGGRSTEFIFGTGYESAESASYRVGSVAWSMKYFADGVLSEQAFKRAKIATQSVLEPALALFPRGGWDKVYGASGTIGAVADILQVAGFDASTVTAEGVEWLLRQLIRAQNIDRLSLQGMKDDRRGVIAGGVSVLAAVMESLKIETLHVAKGALRHGLLFDMVFRDGNTSEDVRGDSVGRLSRRFGIDPQQSQRVSDTAVALLRLLQPEQDVDGRAVRKLRWAAQLHEVGNAISPSDHHKHGAYIIANSDVLGFAQSELQRLSVLVLGQHGKLKKLNTTFEDDVFFAQLLCLRLAVILCHARRDPDLRAMHLSGGRAAILTLPMGYDEQFPQTFHLLNEEVLAWKKADRGFEISMAKAS